MRLDLGGSAARGHSLDSSRDLHFGQRMVGYEHAPVVIAWMDEIVID